MGLFSKKYIYVDVCFLHGKHPYTYRTNDSSIAINTVVMVPAGDVIKPAIVTGVKVYKEKDVPIPSEKLKEIIGKADRANRKLFDGIDMRMPMDISVKTVQTTNGHAVVVTDKLERQALKERYGKRKDITKTHHPIQVFTIYPELNAILERVQAHNPPSFAQLGFVASKFNTENLFSDFPQYTGHERRMSSNVLSFDCFHNTASEDDVQIYGIFGKSKSRSFRAIDQRYVDMTDVNIPLYKIVMPKADGNGTFGDTLTMPEILPPRTGFTHTFLGVGGFQSENEAKAALKYIKTKLLRALLGVLKVTQDLNAEKFAYVPLQDFSSASDIDWSQSIAEIDQQLYRKYGLTEEEITFIESHVKEMT